MKPIRSRAHLEFVRSQRCSIENKRGHVCEGRIEAAHWRGSMEGGIGMKPGDDKAIPLCTSAHREQHATGERGFQEFYGIKMQDIAILLWLVSEKILDKVRRKPKARKAKPATGRKMAVRGFDKTRSVKLRTREVVARHGAARMG